MLRLQRFPRRDLQPCYSTAYKCLACVRGLYDVHIVSGPDGVPGLNDQVLMEHIYALGKASKLDGRMHVAYSTVLGERDDVRAELRRVIVVKAALEQGALVMKKRDRAPGLVRSCEKMLRPIRWILSSVCSP